MRVFVFVFVLGGVVSPVFAQEVGLPTPELRGAALACQRVVTRVASKVATTRFKAVDRCANAALGCVQSTKPIERCLTKAAATCQKILASAAIGANKARTKIATQTKCAALRIEDLLGSDGLGFGALAEDCNVGFGVDVCGGIGALADCLVKSHERAAGALYVRARPRTAELLGLLPGQSVLPLSGVPSVPGCDDCNVAAGAGKKLTKCGQLLTRATGKLQALLDKQFAACAQAAVGCIQSKKPKDDCLNDALNGCNATAGGLAEILGKYVTAVSTGACSAKNVSFATLVDGAGLNFEAVANVCAAAGTSPPASVSELADCLAADARCGAADLARQQVPRTVELDDAGRLGALGAASIATCPSVSPEGTFAALRTLFGPVTKIIKTIKGARRTSGGIPRASTLPKTVSVQAPRRIAFGGLTKIPFRVRLSGKKSAGAKAATPGAIAAAPPTLIIAVLSPQVDDHFELDLPAPGPDGEISGTLDVTYAGDPPSCAFTLGFATRTDGVVSAYTTVMQVADLAVSSFPHEVTLRLSNVDDQVDVLLNGKAVGSAGFGAEERTFDAASAFTCGENVLEIQVRNGPVAYTHRTVLEVDNVSVVDSSCGVFLGAGCNDDDRTAGLVIDEFNYFCVPCDGKPCDGGTCSNPYVLPDLPGDEVTYTVKTQVSGASALGFCGGGGSERVFSLTPAARGCYQLDTCQSSFGPSTLYPSVACGTPDADEDQGCPIDGCGFIDDRIFAAGQTRTIVLDTPAVLSEPSNVTIDVRRFPASFCE